ncbi:MAG TPA: VWA domain-containing protein [Pyrinomonadaceae bacterium]
MLSMSVPVVGQQPTPTQSPAPPATRDDVERVTVNLVQIDVIVTDKNGQQVTDLRPEDVEILENGKRQPITNFSYIAAGSANAAALPTAETAASATGKNAATPVMPARLAREQVRRTIALVVDDLGLSFESLGYAREALTKFVDEQMQPNDLVAILRTSGGVGVLQQFTSDKRQLHAAIERVRWNPQGRGGISPVGTLNEQSVGADIRDNIQFMEEMEESRAGQYSVGTIGTVNSIVRGLGEMPGRKSVVLISEAFRMFSAQGRNTQLVQSLRRLTDEANANSVAIYTLDASGLQSYTFEASDRVAGYSYVIDPALMAAAGGPAMGPGAGGVRPTPPPRTLPRSDTLSAQAEQDSGAAFRRLGALTAIREQQAGETYTVLSYLAQRTGGLFLRNRNDLGSGIGRIMQDQKGYYLIGYRPETSPAERAAGRRQLRDLNVKVKRSGLKVRARSSYAGIVDEDRRTRPRARGEQLTAALISPFASADVRVRLTSLFGDEPTGGDAYIRSLLHLDARDLTFKEESDGRRIAEVEMVAVAFGDSGQVVDQLGYPQTVRAANDAEYQRMLQDGLVYILNFPIKRGGPYQMRVAVRDAASERVGAAMQFVEVPDLSKNRLALSGIVLSNFTEANKANTVEADIQTGPAVRRLRQGMILDYRYNIYNAQLPSGGGSPQLQTQMRIFRDGQPVFTGKVIPFDAGQQQSVKRLNAAGRLRLGAEFTPGQYALQVIVTDTLVNGARRTATQWIDFEISN